MRRAAGVLLVAAAVSVLVLAAERPAEARTQRHWGIYTEHHGIYSEQRSAGEAALPWQRPAALAAPLNAAAVRGAGVTMPHVWVQPIGSIGAGLGGISNTYRSGLTVNWTYGPRMGSRSSFIFSTRSGFSFSKGLFGIRVRW